VERVNWFDAAEFANRLSKKEEVEQCYLLGGCTGTLGQDFTCDSAEFKGLACEGYRLPTETEWEVAARAGTRTAIYTGKLMLRGANHGPELDAIAWYGGNSGVEYAGGVECSGWSEKQYDAQSCGTHAVGTKQANPWQLYDVLGNVWEWCTDWYGTYDSNVQSIDRTGPVQGSLRVIRGGSWGNGARFVRAAYRNRDSPSARWAYLGFRLARGQVPRSSEAEPGAR
jgi:formylglycine-generating enzyme required for sulfatase activity